MTVEKTKDSLEYLLEFLGDNDPDDWLTYTQDEVDALRVAIAMLDKQEPQAPVYQSDGYADGYPVVDVWHCPNCDRQYEDHYRYCPRCGQRINWEGQKENE